MRINTIQLPHRFRESSFHKYEAIISTVIKSYPNVIDINPATYSLSQATFSCRFRDAVKSYSIHKWSSSIIEPHRFDEIFPKDDLFSKVSVAESKDLGLLRIGSKIELKKPDGKFKPSMQPPVETERVFSFTTTQLDALCQLADARILNQKVKCLLVSPSDKELFEQKYDVSIELDPVTNIASIL